MKRLNKNGFAISTMLYGLLIVMVLLMSLLMSTMSFSRSNSKKFVNEVIDNLEYRDSSEKLILEVANPTSYETIQGNLDRWVYIRIIGGSSLIIYNIDLATIKIENNILEEKATCKRTDSGYNKNQAVIGCHIEIANPQKKGVVYLTLNGTVRDINYNNASNMTIDTKYRLN